MTHTENAAEKIYFMVEKIESLALRQLDNTQRKNLLSLAKTYAQISEKKYKN